MVIMAIPTIVFALGNTFMQLFVARMFLGCVGAGFVVGIKMVSQWFPPKYIGRAEGFYAGWGNFGSAFAAMTLPWFAITFLGRLARPGRRRLALGHGHQRHRAGASTESCTTSWSRTCPEGKKLAKTKKTEPMMVTSYGDLAQYLVWSIPLVGALGLLAWRISNVEVDGEPILSETGLYVHLRRAGDRLRGPCGQDAADQPALPAERCAGGREVPLGERGRPQQHLLRQLRCRAGGRVDAAGVLREHLRAADATPRAARW